MKFDLDVTSSEGSTDEALGKEQRTSRECWPLLEAANLNIYRENPFRITGLPVDATAKEIARHADKLKQMEELGYGGKANTAAFAARQHSLCSDCSVGSRFGSGVVPFRFPALIGLRCT